jgi:hypothetical protein
MTVETQLETLMESADAVDADLLESVRQKLAEKGMLSEKKKEEDKEVPAPDADDADKDAADEQDDIPAVSVENPINPELVASDTEGDDEDADDASVTKSVKESVDALLGDEFTEDFKLKAVVIFEAAVKEQVAAIEKDLKAEYSKKAAALQEDFDAKLVKETAALEESLSDEINGYLTLISEQWMSKNDLAVQAGVKAELVESFITGMKTLFEEHYVDLPDEKLDMVSKLEKEKAELTESLARSNALFESLTDTHHSILRAQIMNEASAGFTSLDFERFKTLTEDFAFDSEETFRKKVDIVKTAFFEAKSERRSAPKKEEISESFVPSAPVIEETKLIAEDAPAKPTKMDEYLRYMGKANR